MAAFEVPTLPPLYEMPNVASGEPEGSLTGDLALSWQIGLEQLGGTRAWMQGMGASLLEKAGFEDAAVGQRIAARNLVYDMQDNISSLEALYTGPHSWAEAQEQGTIGSHALWGINEAVKQVPNLAAMALGTLVTGGVGSLLGRVALGRAIGLMPATAFNRSSLAGVALSSALLNTGEIYSSALLETGENNPVITGLSGMLAGSLDLWPGSKVIRSMGKSRDLGSHIANRFLRDKKWRSRLYRALELGATEGLVEDVQTVIEAATVNFLNDNDLAKEYVDYAYGIVPITAEQVAERMEARAAGVLLGAGLGGFGRTGPRRLPQRIKPTLTAQDLQDIDSGLASAGQFEPGGGAVWTPPDEMPDPLLSYPAPRGQKTSYVDPTSQKAASALDIPPKETKAAKKRRLKSAQLKVDIEQLEAELGLGGRPADETGAPVDLEVEDPKARENQLDDWIGGIAYTEPGEGARFGREGAATDQRADLLTAVQLTLASAHETMRDMPKSQVKAAVAERQELKELQKSTLLERYLALIEPRFNQKTGEMYSPVVDKLSQGEIASILDGLSIVIAPDASQKSLVAKHGRITEEEGFPRWKGKAGLIKAIEDFIGGDILANIRQAVGLEEFEALGLGKMGQAAREEARFRNIAAAVEALKAAGRDPFVSKENIAEAVSLVEKYGIPLDTILSRVRNLQLNTQLERKAEADRIAAVTEGEEARRGERIRELGALTGEQTRVALARREEILAEEGKAELKPSPRKLERKTQKDLGVKVRKRRRFETRRIPIAKGIPSEAARRKAGFRAEGYPEEAVTVIREADEKGYDIKGAAAPVTNSDLADFAKSSEFEALVLEDYARSDLGDNIVIPSEFPWDRRGQVQKLLGMYLPDGPDIYELEYFEKLLLDVSGKDGKRIAVHPSLAEVEWIEVDKKYPHKDKDGNLKLWKRVSVPVRIPLDPLGVRIDLETADPQFSGAVLTIANLKAETVLRRIAKRKGIWGEKNWQAKITEKEIEEATKKGGTDAIVNIAPSGTYTVRERPPKGQLLAFKINPEWAAKKEQQRTDLTSLGEIEEVGKYLLDEDGNRIPYMRDKKPGEGRMGVARLFAYDKNDQLIGQQYVDDQRNLEIIAQLDELKRMYGVIKDIPIEELAKVAKEFGIRSKYIGVVRRRGRVKETSMEVANRIDMATLEGSEFTKEDTDSVMWMAIPTTVQEQNYISLGRLSELYQRLLRSTTPEIAFQESKEQVVEDLKSQAKLLYDQIIDQYSDVTISAEELTAILEEEGAIFTPKDEKNMREYIAENRAYLTDPENEKHALKMPKGAKIATPEKVYDSLRGSQSRGRWAFTVGYDETEVAFNSRISAPPRTPKEVAIGSKVQLRPNIWASEMQKEGSMVRIVSEKIIRLKRLLGDKKPNRPTFLDVVTKEANELFERRGEAAVELIYEKVLQDVKSPDEIWNYWGYTDQELFDLANEKGWLSHEYFGQLFPGKKTIDHEVMMAIRRAIPKLAQRSGAARPTKLELSAESQRKLDSLGKLFKKRVHAKPIVTVSPSHELIVVAEKSEAELREGLDILELELEIAIGNFLETEFNIVGTHKKKKDVFLIEPVGGGRKTEVSLDQIVVTKHSQKGINTQKENELYNIAQQDKRKREQGTPASIERASKGETYRGVYREFTESRIGNRRFAMLRNVIQEAEKKVDEEVAKARQAAAAGRMSPSKLETEIQRIQDSREIKFYEIAKGLTLIGRPLLRLPAELQEKVDAGTITAEEGLERLYKAAQKRYNKETRRDKLARVRGEVTENQDIDTLDLLRTPTDAWYPLSETGGQVRAVAEKLVLKSDEPQIAFLLDKSKLKVTDEALIYRALKTRYEELQLAVERRSIKRFSTYEGKRWPKAWREGRHWEFVKSDERNFEGAQEMVERATKDLATPVTLGRTMGGEGLRRVEQEEFRAGEFTKIVTTGRWKNAYGVIIDRVYFSFTPNGKEEQMYQLYEVSDPFVPENSRQFSTLEEAKKVFGTPRYYQKLAAGKYPFAAGRVGKDIPSPKELDRVIRFRVPGLQNRKLTKVGGRPTSVDTSSAPQTTDGAMNDVQDVKVTVLDAGLKNVKKWGKTKKQTELKKVPATGRQERRAIDVTGLGHKKITYTPTAKPGQKDIAKIERTIARLNEDIQKLEAKKKLSRKDEAAKKKKIGKIQASITELEGLEFYSKRVQGAETPPGDVGEKTRVKIQTWEERSGVQLLARNRESQDVALQYVEAVDKLTSKLVKERMEEAGKLTDKETNQLKKKARRDALNELPIPEMLRGLEEIQIEGVAAGLTEDIQALEDLPDALKQRALYAKKGQLLHSLVLEGEYTENGFLHRLFKRTGEKGVDRTVVIDRINEALGTQIFNFVRVVQSEGDLPLNLRDNSSDFTSGVRAVTFNHEVWLIADNISEDRIVPVALHEIGSHGMQAVMGKKFYQKLLMQVAVLANTDQEIGELYDKIKSQMNEKDSKNQALILEEVMAYIVESEAMTDSPFWRAIVDAILYGLARLKLWVNPKWIGPQEILIFAKAAARKYASLSTDGNALFAANFLNTPLYSGDLGHKSSTTARASRLVAGMREHQDPLITKGFEGSWFVEDMPFPERWWEHFLMVREIRPGRPALIGKPIRKLGKHRYQMYVGDDIRKWIEDYFIAVRRLEESIRLRGGVINEGDLPSLYHGAYKNIVNYKRRRFHDEMVQPFENFLKTHKVSGIDLHWWLYAEHAPHRNRVMQEKNGHQFSAGIFSDKKAAQEHLEKTGELHKDAESIKEELINKLSPKELENLQEAAKYVYAINKATLELQLESGLLNLEEVARTNKKRPGTLPLAYTDKGFKDTYVPLYGEGITYNDVFFEGSLKPGKLGISGVEARAATGRVTEAENTWAHSVMRMDHQIDRVEKNKVVMSFSRVILQNKEDLKDFAIVVNRDTYEDHRIDGHLLLGLHEKQQTDPDHNIHFKQNGKEMVILVKDKRIGQAFNRTNMADSGTFMQLASQVNRWFSAVHTSINPEFVLTNFIRDFQTAMINLQGVKQTTAEFKDTEALTRKVFRDIKLAGVGLKEFIRDKKFNTEWSALAKEFSEQGGRIDFFAFRDAAEFEKKLNDYINDTTAAGARRFKNKMLEFVGEYNAVFENTMRLATYKNARDEFIANGMTEERAMRRAADISRNLTVNFSQKGEKGVALNSLYLFFNASVQGTVRMFQAMFRRPKGDRGFTRVQKIMGSIALFSFSQGILNSLLAGDDEDGINRYRQIDLRARGRQAHIYLPGFDTFFKIPLPYGYNIPYVIGDTLAALMMGHTNPGRATMHVMSSAAESFVPFSFGSSDDLFVAALQTVSPTISDPLIDLAVNENYFGQPIYKDPAWGSSDPPSERYWSSTGVITKGISRALNVLSFGSKVEAGLVSIPPDVFEYIWETVAGGAGRFVERSTDLVWMITPGGGRLTHRETGEVKWTKVPFARRFFFDETATRNRFVYDKYQEYESSIRMATGLNDGILEVYGRGDYYNNFKESEDYKLFKLDDTRKDIAGDITRLQKESNKILMNRILRDDVKEERINRLKDKMRDLRVKLVERVDNVLEK